MSTLQKTPRYFTALIAVMTMLACGQLFAAPPDLTQSNTVDRARTYNLGPTGLRGWIYTHPATYLDSFQGRTTAASRQILVTHVGTNSPASGVLEVNDVILGVNGKPFDDDARKAFGRAITEAEKTENKGILKLTRWRAGNTENVQLKLSVMGSYSATAPYDCPKSKLILAEACRLLEKEPLEQNLWGAINGLALLAAGNPDYLPKVQTFAREIGPATLKLELKPGMLAWDWGYKLVFLSEYYLLTGDKEVLHAVNEYTVSLAKGQGLYGTFGHGISDLTPEGKLHGSIAPYGPVNQAGLIANLGIVMGKKCILAAVADLDPEIDPAIGRAAKFFGYYVDKGGIPYGEHATGTGHCANGKDASAALLFSLMGNRSAETEFFARMSVATYNGREFGHTGQGFSYLWSALGANVGGPAAAAAFIKEAQWHLDLTRRCDGSFVYDGGEQYGAGQTDDNTYYGKSSYCGLSPNATYVLTYALPLKKLCITGRELKKRDFLSAKEVAQTIASDRFALDRKQKSPQELIAAFSDWSPSVRSWAAEELAARPEAKALVPQLIAMAEGKDAHIRQGACETLGNLKSVEALPVFVRLLSNEDRWLRYKAAEAIKKLGTAAAPAVQQILEAVVSTAEPLQPINWVDPIQFTHGVLAGNLFSGPLTPQVKQVDKSLLYPAIRVIAVTPDGAARSPLGNYFQSLTVEEAEALSPDLLQAILVTCPADTMFSIGIREGAFKALTKHNFVEGIEAGVAFAKTQGGHGSQSRTGEIMKELVKYGSAAKGAIPGLKELIDQFNEEVKANKFPGGELNNMRVTAVQEAIKAIEAATTHPELRSIKPK